LIVDQQEAIRAGLREVLETNGFNVVAEASDADEAVGAALAHRPQVCLIDLSIPGGGLAAAEQIFAELPDTKIAVTTEAAGETGLLDAIHAGADGYLRKRTDPDGLMLALRALLRGEAAVPRALTGRLLVELRGSGAGSMATREPRSMLRYIPRITYHYGRRRRSGMSVRESWASARARMHEYR
jgi:DNA-binding NarL/FixJ family response regulator